jgi:hypothetical protein
MTHNLSSLTPKQQRNEELKLQASLLIHNLNQRKINRSDINEAIHKLEESEQGQFREYLNMYRVA